MMLSGQPIDGVSVGLSDSIHVEKSYDICYIHLWYMILCGSGETGIHAALRWLWEKSRGGSSPFFRTRCLVVAGNAK